MIGHALGRKKQMLGFWDYTVILTYVSLATSVTGIFCAISMHLRWAIFCLAVSGLCDMFDGKIARTKKNRTEDEKNFGIQIDSLCDVVCFGVLPVIICYRFGMNRIYLEQEKSSRYHSQIAVYKMLAEQYRQSERLRHDMKNHIIVLYS